MDENPYESPKIPGEQSPSTQPVRRMALAIVLGILTLPAAGIAFFSTCLVTVLSIDGSGVTPDEMFSAGLGAGALAGLLVASIMIYYAVRAGRVRSELPANSPRDAPPEQ